jgi:hypothetical protein
VGVSTIGLPPARVVSMSCCSKPIGALGALHAGGPASAPAPVAAGEDGGVVAVWLENAEDPPDDDPEQAGDDDPWVVMAAQTNTGHGCPRSDEPGFGVQ